MDVLQARTIFLDVEAATQKAFFEFIAGEAVKAGYASEAPALVNGFFEREKHGTTGMKGGFAIPHVKSSSVKHTAIMFAKLKSGIPASQWETFDQKPVDKIIAFFIPEDGPPENIKLLTTLSAKLMRAEFQQELSTRNTSESLFEYLLAQISAA